MNKSRKYTPISEREDDAGDRLGHLSDRAQHLSVRYTEWLAEGGIEPPWAADPTATTTPLAESVIGHVHRPGSKTSTLIASRLQRLWVHFT